MTETTSLVTLEKISPPEIPEVWDFAQADKDFDKYIYKWRRLTGDVLSTLWIFYHKLKAQGRRSDLTENSVKLPTWFEWIKAKGIDHDTALNRFKALGWLPSDSLVSKLTGNAENYTPEPIIAKVNEVLGEIDLDPASCELAQQIVKAAVYYTEENDGLTKTWQGRVFLNPPYGMPDIKNFTDKFIVELPHIEAAILLTNDQTDTSWWHKCATQAQAICMPEGRLHFYTPDLQETSPTNGQTFFYYGKEWKKFKKIFSSMGLIMQVLQ